jgi:predicted small integral membrane protein
VRGRSDAIVKGSFAEDSAWVGDAMMIERLLKMFMTAGIAILCAFIVAGNIQDPGSNLLFVQHVFSMDTIMPGSALASHALPIPVLWRIAFWLIVVGEAATGALFALGTVELVRARKRKAREFQAAKRFVYVGAGCGFLVWFLAFLGVGGEWFAMWQSQVWNGQQAAFRIVATVLLVLLFVAQPDAEL